MSTCPPSPNRYDADRRVTIHQDGYTVHQGGTVYEVRHTDANAWGIYTGPVLTAMPVAGGGTSVGIASASKAIAAIIGDPDPDC